MKALPYERPTDVTRSDLMRRVRQRGTGAEDQVANELRGLGLSYRRNVRSLPGSPDFANKTRGWAIFVNGCFWHHHTNCSRGTLPRRNRQFWLGKFEDNRARDCRGIRELRRTGFHVAVIWECEVMDSARLRRRILQLANPRGAAAG
jgi:DNA mismatch endonuclease (patch repair protein)